MEFNSQKKRGKFYNSIEWRNLRLFILNKEPFCRMCALKGKSTYATIVDHIIDLKYRADLCLEPTNLQPLCSECHGHKTYTSVNPNKRLKQTLFSRAYTFKCDPSTILIY